LVTGGSSGLGHDVVHAVLAQGQTPRVFTHRQDVTVPQGAELAQGDLRTGDGLDAALDGVSIIIHCASNAREPGFTTDVEGTRILVRMAQAVGAAHLVFISIVGVERSDYGYYQAKREAECIVESSEVPYTILRATQFHDLVYGLLQSWEDGSERLNVTAGMRFQSVARDEVATRLIELASAAPRGYAPPMRGPETLTIEEMAREYLTVRKRGGIVEAVAPRGPQYSVFRSGVNLLPDNATVTCGRETWAEFLRGRAE
ncbi:MAG: SDR family oxidoreductase, partial [Ktedonobacterales bacterium]